MTKDLFITTASGAEVSLLDPHPGQIRLQDIVHALSRIPRFNGHTIVGQPYSVAQHSVNVAFEVQRIAEQEMGKGHAPERLLRAALFHDAHEAFVGDVPSPIKWAMQQINGPTTMSAFDQINLLFEQAVATRFAFNDLSMAERAVIKKADLTVLKAEVRDLMPPLQTPWGCLEKVQADHIPFIVPWSEKESASRFLDACLGVYGVCA